MNPEQMAQLQMMMGGAKKPEPWTKMVYSLGSSSD